MSTHNDIVEELKSWNSPLAGMSREMPYTVPPGYFEAFADNMPAIAQITGITEPELRYSKKMPYQVPTGYFEALPEEMLALAKADGALLEQPKTPFEVPAGYFSQLPAQMLSAAKAADTREEVKKPKVISPNWKRLWTSTRWAAAAILILGIALSTYSGLERPASIESQLATLPEGVINEYVEQHIDEFDTDLLETTLAANYEERTVQDVDDLSDEEIIQYLNETGWEEGNIN